MGRKVSDVMTGEVICARPSTPYKELVRPMTERHVGAIPVVDDQRHVLGVVSESDLILKRGRPSDVVQRSRLASRRRRLVGFSSHSDVLKVFLRPDNSIRRP